MRIKKAKPAEIVKLVDDDRRCQTCQTFVEMGRLPTNKERFAFSMKECITCTRNIGRGPEHTNGMLDGLVTQLFGQLKDCWKPIVPEGSDTLEKYTDPGPEA